MPINTTISADHIYIYWDVESQSLRWGYCLMDNCGHFYTVASYMGSENPFTGSKLKNPDHRLLRIVEAKRWRGISKTLEKQLMQQVERLPKGVYKPCAGQQGATMTASTPTRDPRSLRR